jgi:hypothetical protein
MRMLISLVLLIFFGALTAYLAKQRGRDPVAWYMLGMFLGILGPLILFLLPALTDKDAVEENEDQKLARLNYPIKASEYSTKEWFYFDLSHQQKGPIGFNALKTFWQEGKLSGNSFVWSDGMLKWQRIRELPGLEELLNPLECECPSL